MAVLDSWDEMGADVRFTWDPAKGRSNLRFKRCSVVHVEMTDEVRHRQPDAESDLLPVSRGRPMKKASTRPKHEEPSAESLAEIPELDFRKLRRIPNPYANRTFVNVRVLESDVERAFPDSEAVNQAPPRAPRAPRCDSTGTPRPPPRRRARATRKRSVRARHRGTALRSATEPTRGATRLHGS